MKTEATETLAEITTTFEAEATPNSETGSDSDTVSNVESIPDTEVISDIEDTPDQGDAPVPEATTATETQPQHRSLDEIRDEFCSCNIKYAESAYRMGKLLIEAKNQFTVHGEWLDWLRSVNFHERRAQRLTRIADGYPNPTTLSDLGQSKALVLLHVPEDARDEFIAKEHMVSVKDGVLMPMSVHSMNVRQFEEAVHKYIDKQKKNAIPKPLSQISQTFPHMSYSETFDVSEPTNTVDGQYEHLRLGIHRLVDYGESLTNNADERNDLADKLRALRDMLAEALERFETA